MHGDELRRLEALEQLVRALVRDVASLREEIGARRAEYPALSAATPAAASARPSTVHTSRERAFVPPPPPAPQRAAPVFRTRLDSGVDLEEFVGRYGTVALGAAVILAGVGVLISWAVAQGLFGPSVRLTLATLLAVVCGVVGWRVRQRRSRRFGDVLLALALALVHLVAWGAGPVLSVVPNVFAFGLAALASMTLAGFASAEDEEPLFTVGIGGALLAPFVTLRGDGSVMLLVFGAIIITASMLPLRRHRWLSTIGLLIVAAAVYTGVSAATIGAGEPVLVRTAPLTFALVLAAGATMLGTSVPLAHAFALAGLALGHTAGWTGGRLLLPFVPLSLAVLLIAYATIRRHQLFARPASLVLPAATLLVAMLATPRPSASWHAIIPLIWSALALAMLASDDVRREVHAFVAAAAGAIAVAVALSGTWLQLGLLVYGVALVLAAERRGLVAPMLVSLGSGAWVATAVFTSFLERTTFGAPFMSGETVVAAALTAALVAASLATRSAVLVSGLRTAAAVAAFLWIRCELAVAISAEVAMFSLILYYALAGMAAITVGSRFGIREVRHVGLAIACYAGLKALWEASDLASVALRFGAFMLVGVFLLVVAYRYWPKRVAAVDPLPPAAN